MRFTSTTSADGVDEQNFQLGDVPGVLWTPQDATGPRPLILLGHGGGQHKKAPGVLFRAHRFVAELGCAAVAVDVPNHGDRTDEQYDALVADNRARVAAGEDLAEVVAGFQELVARQTVPEWSAVLDAVQELDQVGTGPVGYWGVSLGCGLGVPFIAAEPRVRAAVLGLGGAFGTAADVARQIRVPVEFLLQWDDERVPRDRGLALFDALGSADKTLHANPGKHADRLPDHELESTVRFFGRHLVPTV